MIRTNSTLKNIEKLRVKEKKEKLRILKKLKSAKWDVGKNIVQPYVQP